MLITRTSKVSGIERTIDLPITQDQLENWHRWMLIQDAFPNLTNSQREFILSGITDEEWNGMFPPEKPLELGIIHQDVAEMFAERFAANNDDAPIPTQPEYSPPSSRIYSTKNIAAYKFHKLRPVLKYLNENVYLAGGSLRTLLKCSGEQVSDFEHPERAFYIFGSEDGTLNDQILSFCQRKVYVPTAHCMNLAATANVVLYDRMTKRKEYV